jgi:hypothetical protein
MNKVMNNFKKLGKSTLIELVNENVIPIVLKQKFKKGSFYCPFFMPVVKICSEVCSEGAVKF